MDRHGVVETAVRLVYALGELQIAVSQSEAYGLVDLMVTRSVSEELFVPHLRIGLGLVVFRPRIHVPFSFLVELSDACRNWFTNLPSGSLPTLRR
jgi:hypothetical protein